MPRRRRRRRDARRVGAIVILVALVATVIGGTVVALTVGPAGEDATEPDERTEVTLAPTTTLDRAALGPAAQELLELVDTGRSGTWHVTYEVESAELAAIGATASLEIWRRGAEVRQDSVFTDSSGTDRETLLGGPDGTVGCAEPPGEPLTCVLVSPGPLDADEDVLATVLALVGDAQVNGRDANLLGAATRCFAVVAATAEAELCLTAEGVPLVIDDGVLRFEATTVDDAIDDAVFVPPAPVAGPSVTGRVAPTGR